MRARDELGREWPSAVAAEHLADDGAIKAIEIRLRILRFQLHGRESVAFFRRLPNDLRSDQCGRRYLTCGLYRQP